MRNRALLLVPLLAACQPTTPPVPPIQTTSAYAPVVVRPVITLHRITPSESLALGARLFRPVGAIATAAAAAPRSVRGVFALSVRRTDFVGKVLFLNSEADYRDQRSLAIQVLPAAVIQLRARYGRDIEHQLSGKSIRVLGSARRVRIDFTIDGRPSGKYYYQTHVPVGDAAQIELL